ncbi:hypothetical protein So717_17960 [Roseobacter cerasinus]|uniref:Uncharacterized protein n=1 Tax=Roseobacter cerasinus TaxID=2602289 RepID=A0A640VP76_9RHOB|nr:hypothetical protein So717_17960 [Roseobacter cerasinus]
MVIRGDGVYNDFGGMSDQTTRQHTISGSRRASVCRERSPWRTDRRRGTASARIISGLFARQAAPEDLREKSQKWRPPYAEKPITGADFCAPVQATAVYKRVWTADK